MKEETKERRYIIVDDDNRPMTWEEPQLVYVQRKSRSRVYLETYTEKEAMSLIQKSQIFTNQHNASPINYFLIPMK